MPSMPYHQVLTQVEVSPILTCDAVLWMEKGLENWRRLEAWPHVDELHESLELLHPYSQFDFFAGSLSCQYCHSYAGR